MRLKKPSVVKVFLLASILAVLFPEIANAASSCQVFVSPSSQQIAVQNLICTSWAGLEPIAIVAVMVSFLIAAFIFIIGAAIKDDRIRNFGQGELYEAVASAVIVGSFLLLATVLIQNTPAFLITGLSSISPGSTSYTCAPSTGIACDPFVIATNDITTTIGALEASYDCILNGGSGGSTPQLPYPPGPGPYLIGQKCIPSQSSGSSPAILSQIQSGGSYTLNPDQSYGYAEAQSWISTTLSLDVPPLKSGITDQLITSGIDLLKLYDSIEVIAPLSIIVSFITDALYVLWGLYYLLIFFGAISPIFVAIGVIFRALFPTRAFGGMLIAVGVGFYIVAPTLFAFLYSANPFPAVNANPCTGNNQPLVCAFTFSGIYGVFGNLWLDVIFYPSLISAITYSFVTQLANFIGASSQMGGRLRAGFI